MLTFIDGKPSKAGLLLQGSTVCLLAYDFNILHRCSLSPQHV